MQVSEVINKIDEVLAYHLFPPREDGSDPRLCPECHKGHLSIKLGKFGAFLGCSNYPECKYTMPLTDIKEEEEQSVEKKPNPEDKLLGSHNSLNVYLKKGRMVIMFSWAKTPRPQPKSRRGLLCPNLLPLKI